MGKLNMNEVARESLSALMDGEASELELRQVVRACDDTAVRSTWGRMETVRALMRGDLLELAPMSLANNIFAALDQEPELRRSGLLSRLQPLAGLAIAATVALVAVLGVRGLDQFTGADTPSQLVAAPVQSGSTGQIYQPGKLAVSKIPQSYRASGQTGGVDVGRPGELSPGLLAAQHRLKEHMFRHAEYASLNSSRGMMPFARVVSLQED